SSPSTVASPSVRPWSTAGSPWESWTPASASRPRRRRTSSMSSDRSTRPRRAATAAPVSDSRSRSGSSRCTAAASGSTARSASAAASCSRCRYACARRRSWRAASPAWRSARERGAGARHRRRGEQPRRGAAHHPRRRPRGARGDGRAERTRRRAGDDEPANLDLLSRRLAALGCGVLRASSGEQALAIAERERPDLVLLDVMMPGIDGWETCRRLKANAQTTSIPVIFVTAKDQTDDVVTGFEAGGVDYVAKPFEPVELAARVRSALFTKRLQDELRASNHELIKVERSRQELIGMLGHDIRNLANSVVAFLQLVGMGQLDPARPEFAELLGLSESNVSEMLRMVNALLDVYKLEEGRLEAVPQAFRLEELARKSVSQVKPEARAKNITVTSEVGD